MFGSTTSWFHISHTILVLHSEFILVSDRLVYGSELILIQHSQIVWFPLWGHLDSTLSGFLVPHSDVTLTPHSHFVWFPTLKSSWLHTFRLSSSPLYSHLDSKLSDCLVPHSEVILTPNSQIVWFPHSEVILTPYS